MPVEEIEIIQNGQVIESRKIPAAATTLVWKRK